MRVWMERLGAPFVRIGLWGLFVDFVLIDDIHARGWGLVFGSERAGEETPVKSGDLEVEVSLRIVGIGCRAGRDRLE